jgi:AcrR family transcriptional regulator
MATETDGRTQRAARSRTAIEDALFALVGEGVVQPTAQEVAARAGVAARSVFRHFDDLDGLFASLDARLRREAIPLLHDPDPHASLPDRIAALVRQRGRLFDRIAPYKHAADLHRGRSPFVRSQQQHLVGELRARLRLWLPEVFTAAPNVQEAVELVLSFEAWERLRGGQALPRARAIAVVEHAVTTMLGADVGHTGRGRSRRAPRKESP